MKPILFFLAVFSVVFLQLNAQSRDIRIKYEYFSENVEQLHFKAEYYFDTWSEKEVYHGRYSEWSSSGTLIQENTYKDGKLEGKASEYHSNGKIKSITFWKEGVKVGESLLYDKEGHLFEKGNWVDGLADGTFTYYYPNGNIKMVKNFLRGVQQGKTVKYNKKSLPSQ